MLEFLSSGGTMRLGAVMFELDPRRSAARVRSDPTLTVDGNNSTVTALHPLGDLLHRHVR